MVGITGAAFRRQAVGFVLCTEGRDDLDGAIVSDERDMKLDDSIGILVIFEEIRLNACHSRSPIEIALDHN